MKYDVAIVGATGNVGREILKILAEKNFPVGQVYALASKSSVGKAVTFCENETIDVQLLDNFDFSNVDIAFFSAGGKISELYVPKAAKHDCVVIDNTSCFRMDPDVPLVVPEVNIEDLKDYKKKNIIANPNCSTIQMLVALKPLHDLAKIKRIVVSTYQSVSGAGKEAMDELYYQTKKKFTNESYPLEIFQKQIAFNCIPQIGNFMSNGDTQEERKMIEETKRILSNNIKVTATCVRVPVFVGHAESINLEFEETISVTQAHAKLEEAKGVILTSKCITQLDVVKEDAVYVSRLRQDSDCSNALNIWVVADNVRKGAALNAVQIAENLINL